MQLITIAHLGEAQGLIESFDLKKISDSFYEGKEIGLLLTGEGPFEASTSTAIELGRKEYQEVINLGICGALHQDCEIGSIFEIRSLYLAIDGKPQFRSFPVSEEGTDLLTSFERVLDPEKASKLRGVAKLVDREAWGVAFACKRAQVKFRSFKIVSDFAGTLGACELVREKAEEFSLQLASYFEKNLISDKAISEDESFSLGPEFYFTFSSSHRFSSLLQKLSLRTGKSEEAVLKEFPIEEIRVQKHSSKERGKILLDLLEDELDPFRGRIRKKISNLKDGWERKGIRLLLDPKLEEEKITFSFEAKADYELKTKLDELQNFDFSPYERIFKGELDVE